MPKKIKKGKSDVGVNWVQCANCSRWEIYENFFLISPFNEDMITKLNLSCGLCSMKCQLESAEEEIKKLKELIVEI